MRLLLVNLLLLAILGAQLVYVYSDGNSATARGQVTETDGADEATSGESSGVAALPPRLATTISQRPLFKRSREPLGERPPPPDEPEKKDKEKPEPEPEPEPPDPLKATLKAVVMSGNGGWVLLDRPDAKQAVRVNKGDSVAGWRLTDLSPSEASFEQDNQSQTLTLRDYQ